MAIKIYSATYSAMTGLIVNVEVDITKGMPSFSIVGLPDTAVKESRERVRSAIINSGFKFPIGRIVINLAPADIRKIGSLLDLPIALGILIETGQMIQKDLTEYIVFGELSLSGEIKGVRGTLPIIIGGLESSIKKYIFPYENVNECIYSHNTLHFPFNNLKEVVSFINYEDVLPYEEETLKEEINSKFLDFSQIVGQENSKRAMEIAAAGNHNIIIYGSTGVGKTMLANALPSILPSLTEGEELEVAKIYSVSGLLEEGNRVRRPFRKPHHTATRCSIVGGGRGIKAGEVTLAHKGVLFFDELLEFNREVLEVLREPLEEGVIHINRLYNNYKLPSDFLFIGSFNLCPCGKRSLDTKEDISCTCNEMQRTRYLNKLSKALKDRIDIYAYVPRVEYNDLKNINTKYISNKMRERVINARDIQRIRLSGSKYHYNSEIRGRDIYELCRISKSVEKILEQYFKSSKPSLRAHGKMIKLARTIADLDGALDITEGNIIEAMGFRKDYNGEIL